jgi:predicted ATPase
MTTPYLRSFRLKQFKAVRDSGLIRFTPLTVFIGNNGSGKSSITEGLETLQAIIAQGLDRAMQPWRGFEHVWYQGVSHRIKPHERDRSTHTNPMSFELKGRVRTGSFSASLHLNAGPGANELFIEKEKVVIKNRFDMERDSRGKVVVKYKDSLQSQSYKDSDGESELGKALDQFPSEWQFVSLIAQSMGQPVQQHRTGSLIHLAKDGSNLADYLLSIRKLDQQAFDGIVETLQHVLPYAKDIQPALTSELERTVYLQLSEGDFKVPGWLLSTGTLRILAFLALFRHPTPPPLIVIEEIENGLDPRTLHLLVDEIRTLVESGRSQVIVTTHSPYLLDLLDLSHIVMVERIDGQPTFTRPGDQETLQRWAKDFSPGRLYTMGRLNQKQGK